MFLTHLAFCCIEDKLRCCSRTQEIHYVSLVCQKLLNDFIAVRPLPCRELATNMQDFDATFHVHSLMFNPLQALSAVNVLSSWAFFR